jgi:hypothetical protein
VSDAHELHGPFIKAAVLCERILDEKDGVLSAIRIFDRASTELQVDGDGGEESVPNALIQGALLVAIVAGDAARNQVVTVRLVRPSGSTTALTEFPVEFTAEEDAAAQLVLRLTLELTEEGLHWFEILIGDGVKTRIPLRVSKTIKRRS